MTWITHIDWTEKSIEHIARHNVIPREVEEGIFDDAPHLRTAKIVPTEPLRTTVYCQSVSGRYLFVVITPAGYENVRVVTARDMSKKEVVYYKKRRK